MWGQRSSKGHLGLLTFWLRFLKVVSNVFSWDLDINDPWVDSDRYLKKMILEKSKTHRLFFAKL